jgi:glutaredoxin
MIFTVYSKPACTFCEQAKSLIQSKGYQYKVINLDVGQPKVDGETYITRDELLARFPHAKTMPQVCVETATSASHLGGYTELKEYLSMR